MKEMAESLPIVTLTTDFGTREFYAGALKGAILAVCPGVSVIDITHEVRSHDVFEAAFTLACAYSAFPPGTTHMVVVDPGVGSDRRGVAVSAGKYFFVAPDNGCLSLALQREPVSVAVTIEAGHYFRTPVSDTFHGRDIFGPVAAYIARGIPVSKFGSEISDLKRLNLPGVKRKADGVLEGVVLHVDKFGNVITNITPESVASLTGTSPAHFVFVFEGQRIERHCRFYAEGAEPGPFSLLGSSGFYEIAAWRDSAARILKARRGSRVELEVRPS